MNKIRVGVLRGGRGDHYKESMRRGQGLISAFLGDLENDFQIFDIFLDKEGVLHLRGLPINPYDLQNKLDMVWSFLHPKDLTHFMDLNLPIVGISSFDHSIKSRPDYLHKYLKNMGYKKPRNILLPLYQEDFDGDKLSYSTKKAKDIWQKFPPPWVVKAVSSSTTLGIKVANTFPELVQSILETTESKSAVLIEELIYGGRRIRVHGIEGFRGEGVYFLPPLEVRHEENTISYQKDSFTNEEKKLIYKTAKNIFENLGTEHYVNFEFILDKKGGIYISDFDLYPEFTEESSLSFALDSFGIDRSDVLRHIAKRACALKS